MPLNVDSISTMLHSYFDGKWPIKPVPDAFRIESLRATSIIGKAKLLVKIIGQSSYWEINPEVLSTVITTEIRDEIIKHQGEARIEEKKILKSKNKITLLLQTLSGLEDLDIPWQNIYENIANKDNREAPSREISLTRLKASIYKSLTKNQTPTYLANKVEDWKNKIWAQHDTGAMKSSQSRIDVGNLSNWEELNTSDYNNLVADTLNDTNSNIGNPTILITGGQTFFEHIGDFALIFITLVKKEKQIIFSELTEFSPLNFYPQKSRSNWPDTRNFVLMCPQVNIDELKNLCRDVLNENAEIKISLLLEKILEKKRLNQPPFPAIESQIPNDTFSLVVTEITPYDPEPKIIIMYNQNNAEPLNQQTLGKEFIEKLQTKIKTCTLGKHEAQRNNHSNDQKVFSLYKSNYQFQFFLHTRDLTNQRLSMIDENDPNYIETLIAEYCAQLKEGDIKKALETTLLKNGQILNSLEMNPVEIIAQNGGSNIELSGALRKTLCCELLNYIYYKEQSLRYQISQFWSIESIVNDENSDAAKILVAGALAYQFIHCKTLDDFEEFILDAEEVKSTLKPEARLRGIIANIQYNLQGTLKKSWLNNNALHKQIPVKKPEADEIPLGVAIGGYLLPLMNRGGW